MSTADATGEAGGIGSGVHWFVAWRYLLSEERKASRAILTVIALCLWVIAGFGVVALWLYPLSHPEIALFQPVPWWVVLTIGMAASGVIFMPLIAGRPLQAVGFSGPSGDLPRADLATRYAPKPFSIIAAISCAVIAINMVHAFSFLHRPFGGTDVPAISPTIIALQFVGIFAMVVVFPVMAKALARSVSSRGPRERGFSLFRFLVLLLFAFSALIFLLSFVLMPLGIAEVFWPARKTVENGNIYFYAGTAIAAIGVVGFLISGLVGAGNRSLIRWSAIRAIWIGLGLLALLGFLHVRMIAMAGGPPTGFVATNVRLPSVVTLPILIASSLIVLSIVLLGIRGVFSFFSTVSIGGVAIGSMALVIVLSVMGGFENDLRRKILGSNAHVLVTKANDKPLICRAVPDLKWKRCVLDVESAFTEYREIGAKVDAVDGVVASSPYLISEVVIAANNNYANVIIKGVEPETVGAIGELDENVRDKKGNVDKDALMRLWPLAEDGAVIGKPDDAVRGREGDSDSDTDTDGDGFSDAIPEDPEPVDFSDLSAAAADEPNDEPSDESDGDATEDDGFSDDIPSDPEPIDFSGAGSDAGSDGLQADAGPDAASGRAVRLTPFPPMASGSEGIVDLSPDDEFIRRIPPLVAILPGTLVGKELVKQINLYDGQEVRIVSPLGQDTPMGPVPRTKDFRVAGTFFTGMYEYDLKFIYIEIGGLQDFLDLGDEVTGIEIRVEDPSDPSEVVARLGESLGPEYRIQDWQELNRSLFSALKLEKIAMFLVLAIIILVASFSIVGNLIMVVVEKAREIAVLKTLGTSDLGIQKIFVTQGFFIGLVGTGLGVSLGLIACIGMATFGLPLDPDVYYIDRLPIHIEPVSVALVFAAGVVISVVATLYPAYVASSMRPVNGLRYE